MVLVQWIERGLGQLFAPDPNYRPKPDDLDTKSGFWQVVAPDPNFTEPADGSTIVRVPPSAAFQYLPRTAEVECIHCHKMTPILTAGNATPKANTNATALEITPTSALNDPQLDRLVLEACYETSKTGSLPYEVREKVMAVFRLCSSNQPIADKLLQRLRAKLEADPTLFTRRSFNTGNHLPNGLTLIMAAAHHDQIAVMDLLWELGSPDQLFQVTVSGQTAEHLAAEFGHTQALEKLIQWRREIAGISSPAPIDLAGQTPYGAAVTSPHPKAQKHKAKLTGLLFSPQDASVLGSPVPAAARQQFHRALGLAVAHAAIPGRRGYMEDAVAIKLYENMLIVCVCDGHDDGGQVSNFCASLLPDIIYNTDETLDWATRCVKACLEVDSKLQAIRVSGGSTAIVAIVTQEQIVVANVGDSRCILAQEGQVVALSQDHKPGDAAERERIEKAGCEVLEEKFMDKGVEHTIHKVLVGSSRLACSRTFGDFEYKANESLGPEDQAVVAVPDVVVHNRVDTDRYLILACDGIWDVMNNDQVGQYVYDRASQDDGPVILSRVCDDLVQECLALQSTDNLSVIVVALDTVTELLTGVNVMPRKALDFSSENVVDSKS